MTDNDRQHTNFNQCLRAPDRGPEKEVLTRKAVYETLFTMILELRHRPAGLGYQRQRWPRAVHHIARLGRTEARLIVEDGEQPTLRQVVVFLIAAILTNP
jgi:CRISPR/Cas system-associated protein Cas5 (RAMP superfamily)